MTDDKENRGAARGRVASKKQGYEVSYFATKHGISRELARDLMARIGSDRDKLNETAKRLKRH